MAKIESLTPEQEAQLEVYRDHWLEVGLSTQPADRKRAERGAAMAYQAAGLEPPSRYVWFDSPIAGAQAAALAAKDLPLDLSEKGRKGITKADVQAQINRSCWGQHNAGWWSYLDYMDRVLGVEGADKIRGLCEVAEASGWWWPFEDLCILTERPTDLKRDQQNRLHNTNGPALLYPDGFGVYAWHGRQVPKDLIEEGWSIEKIMKEQNAEIRRCAIDRMGWDQFIAVAGLKLVAKSDDPGNAGQELFLYDLGEKLRNLYDAPARILLCTNGTIERDGTRHRFGLPVPGHHTDPVAAAADLYDWPVEEYRKLGVRR